MGFEELYESLELMMYEGIEFKDETVALYAFDPEVQITSHSDGSTTAIIHPRGTALYAKVKLVAKRMAYYVAEVFEEPESSLHECGWQSGHPGLY